MAGISFWEALAAVLGGAGQEYSARSRAGMGYAHEMDMAKFAKEATKERDENTQQFEKTMEGLKATNKLNEISAQGVLETALQTAHDQVWERVQNGLITEERARTEMQRRVALIEAASRRYDSGNQLKAVRERLQAEYPESGLYAIDTINSRGRALLDRFTKLQDALMASGNYGPESDILLRKKVQPYIDQAVAAGEMELATELGNLIGANEQGQTPTEEAQGKRESMPSGGLGGIVAGIGKAIGQDKQAFNAFGQGLWTGDFSKAAHTGPGIMGASMQNIPGLPFYDPTAMPKQFMTPEEEQGNPAIQQGLDAIPSSDPKKDKWKKGIQGVETPDATRPTQATRRNTNGTTDYGTYQINSANLWPKDPQAISWLEEAGLPSMSPEEFMADSLAQEQVADWFYEKHKHLGFAAMDAIWHGGPKATPKTKPHYVRKASKARV